MTLCSTALAALFPPASLGTLKNAHSTAAVEFVPARLPSRAALRLCAESRPARSSVSPQYAHPSARFKTYTHVHAPADAGRGRACTS